MKMTAIELGTASPCQFRQPSGDQRGKWTRKGKTNEGARRRQRLELALEHITARELSRRVGRTEQAVSACRRQRTWVSDEWMAVIEDVIKEGAA
jgi:hypothetical protein